ncbi:uncharacterized protein BDR25DRAFT_332172 [Lindgomyces ingoldianus]|uniref:Uncharacterized protein n=1 Tax=Lindgomyces ingoldianus TaxID=673940 RepID=A0ACB6R7S9_9PLEO|nr:uncharacterized protein BDR25DRAFT_332172 [Lindgomyces ingoldianus]KAF2474863.1 hypothetical protein BDR25DRAFT_332172 [Lindgomyces ingoldianus]
MSRNPFPRSYKYLNMGSSDHIDNTSPNPPRRGFWHFLRHNLTIVLAFSTGLACVVSVIIFTSWLSNQVLHCPDWSVDCHVSRRIHLISGQIGTVQGLITAVFAIGLAALAYAAHAFSESALWPLLNKQSFTIREMGTYIEASRGSILSSPLALLAARNFDSSLVILCTVLITLAPLSGAPLVGYVYDQRNLSVEFKSVYQPGGGIGVFFTQQNPPGPRRDAAQSLYTSWAFNLSSEPMPEYRNWFIDRRSLLDRGNMTVGAVMLKQNISCKGWKAEPTDKKTHLRFKTKMATHNRTKHHEHSEEVQVRDQPRLAVWTHDYAFHSPTRTSATIIFAALNGTIEDGLTTTNLPDNASIVSISSIACEIDINLIDETLTVGSGAPFPTTPINSIKSLQEPGGKEAKNSTWNELALWFAVAPVANGASVYGAQPMYSYNHDWIPLRYTSVNGGSNAGWTIPYIKNFIQVSIGASMLGETNKFADGKPIVMPSLSLTLKLDPTRTLLLLIPPLVILALGSLLIAWNISFYRRRDIPIMRKASLCEILKSAQTEDVKAPRTSPERASVLALCSKADDGDRLADRLP